MKSRFKTPLNRAKYAAIGAAVGAAVGGLFSRNAASSGGALGALVGATFGETRVTVDTKVQEVKERVRSS